MPKQDAITIMDTVSMEVSRTFSVMVFALEGLYERHAQRDPNIMGIRDFHSASSPIISETSARINDQMRAGMMQLQASLSVPERDHFQALDDTQNYLDDAQVAIWGASLQAQALFIKRYREMIAAGAGTRYSATSVQIMTRNGRRWNFSDYVYLTARGTLINWHNNGKISYIRSLGAEMFFVDTLNPSMIMEVYKVDNYPRITDQLFHPRTTKLVGGPYVSTKP